MPSTSTSKRTQNIFIGFSEVAGYYSNLSDGFKSLGFNVTFYSFGPNIYKYNIEKDPDLCQRIIWWSNSNYLSTKFFPLKVFWYLLHCFLRTILLLPKMLASDLILLNYSGTLFFYTDLVFLWALRKKVVYLFHGSDARPPYFNGKFIYPDYSLSRLYRLTFIASLRISLIEKFSYKCVVPKQISHFFSTPLINFSKLGVPWPLHISSSNISPISTDSISIVHAPSNSLNKGTQHIRSIIAKLKSEGHNFYYTEVIGKSNSEVLSLLRTSSLVIDELWSDARLAGLAAEAATFGVPSIIGTYYDDVLWNVDTHSMDPLIFSCLPESLESELRKLLLNPERLHHLSNRLINYRQRLKTYTYASNLLSALYSEPGSETYIQYHFDPLQCSYLYGWGAPSSHVSAVLRQYVRAFGLKALRINRKSFLYKHIIQTF